MIVQAVFYFILVFGSCFFYIRCVGTILNCVVGCFCQISIIAMALFNRFSNPYGRRCALNNAPVNYEGDGKFEFDGPTYKDDAAMIVGFAAVQMVLLCCQFTCCCVPLCLTPVVYEDKDGKAKKSNDN